MIYQAPNRFHVLPVTAASTQRPAVEQIVIGANSWQGSARAGWVAFHTRRPTDPLYWLETPVSSHQARWTGGSCTFRATVAEGEVVGRAGFDRGGRIVTLALTLMAGRSTIQMGYRISRIGSSPPVVAPRP